MFNNGTQQPTYRKQTTRQSSVHAIVDFRYPFASQLISIAKLDTFHRKHNKSTGYHAHNSSFSPIRTPLLPMAGFEIPAKQSCIVFEVQSSSEWCTVLGACLAGPALRSSSPRIGEELAIGFSLSVKTGEVGH